MPSTGVRSLDHTADVGFELRAPGLPALFDAARRALLAQLMASPPAAVAAGSRAGEDGSEDEADAGRSSHRKRGGGAGAATGQRLLLEAPAVDRLLLRWLDELLYQVQTCGSVPARASLRITPPAAGGSAWRLDARLSAVPLDAEAHGWRGEIKGVTYHGLLVERHRGGWRARVILDV